MKAISISKWVLLFVACVALFNIYAQEGIGKPGATGSTGPKGHSGVTGQKGDTGTQHIKFEPGVRPDTVKTKAKAIPPDFDKSHPYK